MKLSIFCSLPSTLMRWLWFSAYTACMMAMPLYSYAATNTLLEGQILHIACNGDADDKSRLQHSVENNGVVFFRDKMQQREMGCFFNGNAYLKIPKHPAFNVSDFTISAWVQVEGTGTGTRAIVSNYASENADDNAQHYGINIKDNHAAVFYDDGTLLGGARDVGGTVLNDGQWHHIAAVFKGGVNTKIYVDGEPKRQSSSNMPTSITPSGDLYIGRGGSTENLESRWVGSIDDVRIFNRALPVEEASLLTAVLDLPTGETFIPSLATAAEDEDVPYFVQTDQASNKLFKITPNPDESLSINDFTPDDGLRDGDRTGPSKTSTLIIKDGEMTLIDEATPGVVAHVNLFGDLEVTDARFPDLKLILLRNTNYFLFESRINPDLRMKINPDATVEVTDKSNPELAAVRDSQGNITVFDRETNAITMVDPSGNAVFKHPDMPDVEAIFNIYDTDSGYIIKDTTTNDCIEVSNNGLRSANLRFKFKDLAGDVIDIGGSAVKDVVKGKINTGNKVIDTVLKTGAEKLIDTGKKKLKEWLLGDSKVGTVVGSVVSGGAAKALGSVAGTAVSKLKSWWCCLSPLAKFGVVGGVIGVGVALVAGILHSRKQRKEIKRLQGQVKQLQEQVQYLNAVVEQQDAEIQALRDQVGDQAEQIIQLQQEVAAQREALAEQAQNIANLEDKVELQAEEIAKQKEINDALQAKVEDLERRIQEAQDDIPDGDPIGAAATRMSLRNSADANQCRTAVAPAACKVYGVQDADLNDSIFFFHDPENQAVTQIGEVCEGCDVESMAIHPANDEIYLGSGDNAEGHPNGHLYKLDAETGTLRSVGSTGFDDISGLTFDDDGQLWGWAKGHGLITLDITTGAGTLELASDTRLADLSWDSHYKVLYGVMGRQLWAYDPEDGNATRLCINLPPKTEAVKALPNTIMPAGLIWIGSHNDTETQLQAYDLNTCEPLQDYDLTVGYDDVEGLAMPLAACM